MAQVKNFDRGFGDPLTEKIQGIIAVVVEFGAYEDGRHSIEVGEQPYTLWVRDVRTGSVVAYSSMKADFEQSIVEFATDYFA